ncbi:hypothetical protein AAF712_011370 [Marasmius tenuissimus]|uniref:DUF1264-domain-containing protein n=1 Tax=Marasmius tenuissimus TaxID=585030 RepID=A0ABR2ZN04_9AGAR
MTSPDAKSLPTTNEALGEPLTATSKVLETGASATQDFRPVQNICAHLNAFHVYANDTSRFIETNHYCSHLNEGQFLCSSFEYDCRYAIFMIRSCRVDVRQCILYDGPGPNARLIGIEYMITPKLYATLPQEERRYWHSHVFEVKSGMLIMPQPLPIPTSAWEAAETKEMEMVIELYGKVFHLWQTDRGDKLPLGETSAHDEFYG